MRVFRLLFCGAAIVYLPTLAITSVSAAIEKTKSSDQIASKINIVREGIHLAQSVKSAPSKSVPPPPARPAPAPTYAPGGHAIIPTVPQTNYGPVHAPAPQQYGSPTSNQPGYQSNGPTYAPGGHAIIPTVPQAPSFSPQFNIGGQTTPSTVPTQSGSTRLNLSPATTSVPSTAHQNIPTTTNQTHPTPQTLFPSAPSRSTSPNAFQGTGGQTTSATGSHPTVGAVAPAVPGRLNFVPVEQAQQTSQTQAVKLTLQPVPTVKTVQPNTSTVSKTTVNTASQSKVKPALAMTPVNNAMPAKNISTQPPVGPKTISPASVSSSQTVARFPADTKKINSTDSPVNTVLKDATAVTVSAGKAIWDGTKWVSEKAKAVEESPQVKPIINGLAAVGGDLAKAPVKYIDYAVGIAEVAMAAKTSGAKAAEAKAIEIGIGVAAFAVGGPPLAFAVGALGSMPYHPYQVVPMPSSFAPQAYVAPQLPWQFEHYAPMYPNFAPAPGPYTAAR